jgi:hypothetical protein
VLSTEKLPLSAAARIWSCHSKMLRRNHMVSNQSQQRMECYTE